MVMTTWVWAAIASSVFGDDASAVSTGQDCADSPRVSRTASNRSVDRPASAIRAFAAGPGQVLGGQLAHEAGRPVQDDVVFPRWQSRPRRYSERLRPFAAFPQHVLGQERDHHLVPDFGVLRRDHPVVLGGEIQEPVRAAAVVAGGQR